MLFGVSLFLYLQNMNVQFESVVEYLEKLKLHYIPIPKNVLEELGNNKGSIYNQRVDISVNAIIHWKGGTVALGNEKAYITFSKARMKEANVALGDKVTVQLKPDDSEFGFDVPQEWEAVLEQDPMAKERFLTLKKGLQRATIYLVLQVKSSQGRIDKSLGILENLKRSPIGQTTMRHILGKDLP